MHENKISYRLITQVSKEKTRNTISLVLNEQTIQTNVNELQAKRLVSIFAVALGYIKKTNVNVKNRKRTGQLLKILEVTSNVEPLPYF